LRWIHPLRRAGALLVLLTSVSHVAAAQEDHGHDDHLHFSHPLFTESITPDTKLRLDFGEEWEVEGRATELELEAEYAFHRAVSVELAAPYVFLHPDVDSATSGMGNLEVALKLANFAFAEHGVLLGYGLAVGLPTGDAEAGTGTDHIWELEPFLNLGFAVSHLEVVGWGRFGIPTNQYEGEDVETDFSYDISALYHVSERVQALVELNGRTGLSGETAEAGKVAISPGVKVAPVTGSPLFLGLGVSFPIDGEETDARLKASLFWHF